MYVWKFAILRSVISNILKNEEWNQDVSDADKKLLKEYEEVMFPKYKVPKTIYAEARSILSQYYTKIRLMNFQRNRNGMS